MKNLIFLLSIFSILFIACEKQNFIPKSIESNESAKVDPCPPLGPSKPIESVRKNCFNIVPNYNNDHDSIHCVSMNVSISNDSDCSDIKSLKIIKVSDYGKGTEHEIEVPGSFDLQNNFDICFEKVECPYYAYINCMGKGDNNEVLAREGCTVTIDGLGD